MKTTVSIPDPLFQAADELSSRLGLSRSELFARAVDRYLRLHRNDKVTEALNRVYRKQPARLDPALDRMQFASLPRPREDW